MSEGRGESEPPPGWQVQRLGGELAWIHREQPGLFLFGIGPARANGTPEERAHGVLAALGAEADRIRWGRQVHGARVFTVSARAGGPRASCVGDCDAVLTRGRRTAVLVWTADCVPVLLAGGEAVAAVHAGWRGAAAGVVRDAAARIRRLTGVPLERVRAYLGPSVGPCHYPVGPEVVEALAASGVESSRWAPNDRVDLRAFLEAELEQLGVRSVGRVGGCVACSGELASFRRDGPAAGRQLSLAIRVG